MDGNSIKQKALDYYNFEATQYGVGRWLPWGIAHNGVEIWCDGTVVTDKIQADRIATSMKMAYREGVEIAISLMKQSLSG